MSIKTITLNDILTNRLLDGESGDFSPVEENFVTVEEDEDISECFISNEKRNLKHLIIKIDRLNSITSLRPINTILQSNHYFEAKYIITEFIFEGFDIEIDDMYNDGYGVEGLPKGFTKSVSFGLGLEKKYKVLINTILKHFSNCQKLIISKIRNTKIHSREIVINYQDFEKIRKGIDRNQDLFWREGQIAKETFIYDNIFNFFDPLKYPIIKLPPRKDVIYKILRNTEYSKTTQSDKSALSILKDNTDLSYLTILMNEFQDKILGKHKEATYQYFFEQNPILLTFFSGSPFVKFKNQAYVGGKSFDNSNGQYPDFLQKHKLTNNTFIIEIKTPETGLLDKTAYRDTGIYNPSKHLSGSITQILTQKYNLETEISTLMKNSLDRNVEAYNVQGLLIIGNLTSLDTREMIRSFELFRNNQKNIRIVTYDECLEQLKTFIGLLSHSFTVEDGQIID